MSKEMSPEQKKAFKQVSSIHDKADVAGIVGAGFLFATPFYPPAFGGVLVSLSEMIRQAIKMDKAMEEYDQKYRPERLITVKPSSKKN